MIFGDVICFSTSLVTKDFKKGEWISHDTKLLNLDPNTGVGQVIGMHSDSVSMHYSLTPTSNIHMDILPITKVYYSHFYTLWPRVFLIDDRETREQKFVT